MDWIPFWDASDIESTETVRLAPDSDAGDVTWSVAGPFTPARVLDAADEIDRVTRYLAHATREDQAHTSVPCGEDLHRLISALCTGFGRLDQVLLQVRHRARELIIDSDRAEHPSEPAPTGAEADLLHALDSAAERIRDAVNSMAST